MLKKVMIICLALSFVFFGSIAFAMDEEPGVPNEGQEISPGPNPLSGDGVPDGSTVPSPIGPNSDFISPYSSMIIAGQNGNEYAYDQEDGPIRDRDCED